MKKRKAILYGEKKTIIFAVTNAVTYKVTAFFFSLNQAHATPVPASTMVPEWQLPARCRCSRTVPIHAFPTREIAWRDRDYVPRQKNMFEKNYYFCLTMTLNGYRTT